MELNSFTLPGQALGLSEVLGKVSFCGFLPTSVGPFWLFNGGGIQWITLASKLGQGAGI